MDDNKEVKSQEEEPESFEEEGSTPFNIRWVALGVLFIVVVIGIGHGLIDRFVLKGDPEVRRAISKMEEADERINSLKHKIAEAQSEGRKDENLKRRLEEEEKKWEEEKPRRRRLLLGNFKILAYILVGFLIMPLFVGGVIGYYTQMRREGVAGVAVGMAGAAIVIEGNIVLGVLAAVLYSGLGFLSSWAGIKIAQKPKR